MDGSDFIPRGITSELIDALREARIVAVLGPRQAGKSTLARSLREHGFDASFHSLDDDATREAARLDPAGYLQSIGTPAIIDEIQRAPELMLALKSRVDSDPTPGQYLLTGSANLTALSTVRDTLPGRVDFLDLWPLSQGELARAPETFIDRVFEGDVPMMHGAPIGRAPYAPGIVAGGFPEAVARSERGRARYFDGYVRSLFGRDARDIGGADPRVTDALLRLLATRNGALANMASLGRAVGVSEKTAAAHVDTLELLLLARRHRPLLGNLGKRLIKAPRIFLTDTGLACQLCGFDEQRITDDGDAAGPMFEGFVAMELLRQSTWSDTRVQMLHYRDKDQLEVDIVLERGDGTVVAIEVKSRATVRSSDLRALNRLRTRLGSRFACGIIAYVGADTLPFGDRIWAMPISGLWTPA